MADSKIKAEQAFVAGRLRGQLKWLLKSAVASSSRGVAHTAAVFFRRLFVIGITLHIPD